MRVYKYICLSFYRLLINKRYIFNFYIIIIYYCFVYTSLTVGSTPLTVGSTPLTVGSATTPLTVGSVSTPLTATPTSTVGSAATSINLSFGRILRVFDLDDDGLTEGCKTPFTNNESFFLSFGDPENQTMEEFNANWDNANKEREKAREGKVFCGECEGTTNLGKKCTCSAMKNSEFCRFHK